MRAASRPRRRTISNGARQGVKQGDLIFAAGNPEVTSRTITAAELKYLRRFRASSDGDPAESRD